MRYTATLYQALGLARAASGTTATVHQATSKWLEAEQIADRYGVVLDDRMPPVTVASQAYNAGAWELARAAFLVAWQRGAVGPNTLEPIDELYYPTLVNLGNQQVASGDASLRNAGLVWLRTAEQIAVRYHL